MLAALLSLGAVHAAQPLGTSQPSNLWTQVTLASQYFDYVPLGYGSTALVFAVQSNATVSTMVMNSAQFSNFNSTGTAAWVYGVNATSLRQAVALSANDDYYLVILAVSSTASVYFTWQTYSFGALAEPQPTGVASYGLYNDSGALAAYTVKASEVAGTADMSSLRAFNSTAALANSTVYGASLHSTQSSPSSTRTGRSSPTGARTFPTSQRTLLRWSITRPTSGTTPASRECSRTNP